MRARLKYLSFRAALCFALAAVLLFIVDRNLNYIIPILIGSVILFIIGILMPNSTYEVDENDNAIKKIK
ncbi:MAG: hypothetical protein H6553_07560 [Chitinophagales bacterium]|nr:hypothetical protein [Chitinophagales bacterium]